ncbi:MAG: hypothetical protein HRT40_07675 [Campylobacteraceae bacterium]|nr:hypothetical protein [Campylobacteraceae bacterium]
MKKHELFISKKELDIIHSAYYPIINFGINLESSKSLNIANSTSINGESINNNTLKKVIHTLMQIIIFIVLED